MSDSYQPVSCQLHSELELAAMHRAKLKLTTPDGEFTGRITDIIVKDRAEYLILQDDDSGTTHRLRLDSINSHVAID